MDDVLNSRKLATDRSKAVILVSFLLLVNLELVFHVVVIYK